MRPSEGAEPHHGTLNLSTAILTEPSEPSELSWRLAVWMRIACETRETSASPSQVKFTVPDKVCSQKGGVRGIM